MLLHFSDPDSRLSITKRQKRILKIGYVSKGLFRNNPYKRTGNVILFRDKRKNQLTIPKPFYRNFCTQNKITALRYKNTQILPGHSAGNSQTIDRPAVHVATAEKMIIQSLTTYQNPSHIFSIKGH